VIYEWTPEGVPLMGGRPEGDRNFGDALIDVVYDIQERIRFYSDPEIVYCLMGSVITNTVIEEILRENKKPVFIRCGYRGDPLNSSLLEQCSFFGVRGVKTQEALRRYGIDTWLGMDPGYDVPLSVPQGDANARILMIPHILDPNRDKYQAKDFGADMIVKPIVTTEKSIIDIVRLISGARFVLTGSLHGAIIAHAYKVPFGLFSTDHVDCPFKWQDWAETMGISPIKFFDNVTDARHWYLRSVPIWKGLD